MIFPYGHEHTTVRRLPWVTFTLMGLCCVVFALTSLAAHDTKGRAEHELGEFFSYFTSHPYLEIDPNLEQEIFRYIPEAEFRAFVEASRELGARRPSHPLQVEHEQEELDRIMRRLMVVLRSAKQSPFYRFGLVPKQLEPHAVLTHQFLHGGALHLIGNLFFLFLAGPFIEDVWGRPVFASFYLASGAVAGLMFAVRYPQLDVPLIGASGAIAGVMGAFLIRYWRSRIRFVYFFFPIRPGTFSAPAWLMLPLWFTRELVFAQGWDVVSPGTGGPGVAHWAHVWGFAFGLVVAAAMVYWKVEDRFIHRVIESKVTLLDNSAVEEAMEARAAGESERALLLLRQLVEKDPDNVDAVVALWNAEREAGQPAAAAAALLRVLRSAARSGDEALVAAHWEELIDAVPNLDVDPALAARVAEIMVQDGRREAAQATVAVAARRVGEATPVGPLVRLARAAGDLGAPAAGALARQALARDDLPDELREPLGAIAATEGGAEQEPEATVEVEASGEVEVIQVAHHLEAMEAIPRSLEDGTLELLVNGAVRHLSLRKVQAIAVGGVVREGKRPVVVVDLMLDPPWSDRDSLRVVRIVSTAFDPRSLVGGPDPQEAFKAMLGRMLDDSGASPLPDPDAARGRPFRTYGSLAEYHAKVLGVREVRR